MRHTVTISARKLKRYEAAENVARGLRTVLGIPNYQADQHRDAMAHTTAWLIYWLERAGTDRYDPPPPIPSRWQYNRDQAARGWPDLRPTE